MNKYRFFLAVICFFPHFLRAQKIDSMLNIYANNYPQEKIYLQLDKKIYRAGETVWFKAYIFTGADPSLSSMNFYAEFPILRARSWNARSSRLPSQVRPAASICRR